jgi:hypothetical protein
LDKDAPVSRPVQRTGVISSRAIFIITTPVFKFWVHTAFCVLAPAKRPPPF